MSEPMSKYFKMVAFYAFYVWTASFAKAVLPPYFLHQGFSLNQILFAAMLGFLGLFLIFLSKFSNIISSRKSWFFSYVCILVYMVLILKVNSAWKLYLASLINGFSVYLFYFYYNVAHFRNTAKEKTGHSSAIMFSVGPAVAVIVPLFAGSVASFNYDYIWILSGLFFLVGLYITGKQDDFSVKYGIFSALEEIKSTRVFIFLEGVWEAMIFGVIPVYSLFFIKTPLGYGTFLAYLSLASIVANLSLGKVTDRVQKRAVFLYPITILMAVITMLFSFTTTNIIWWIVIAGSLQFLLPLFWNITTAMVVDSQKNLELAMAGREAALNAGRFIGILLAFVSFTLEKTPFYLFFILGIVMLLFPTILWWRTKVTHKYSYL